MNRRRRLLMMLMMMFGGNGQTSTPGVHGDSLLLESGAGNYLVLEEDGTSSLLLE